MKKADYISFFFNKHEFKLIKVNNDCGLNNTDYIEFTDKEVLEQGFLEALKKIVIYQMSQIFILINSTN